MERRPLQIEQLASGAQGLPSAQVLLSTSAASLSGAAGVDVPERGEGTYLGVFWGEHPTGGYSVKVKSAELEGDRVTVHLTLQRPDPGMIVTQALTYPYAVVFMQESIPDKSKFIFLDQDGRELNWPVKQTPG